MTLSNRERLGRPHCGQSVHLCDIELCGAFLCAHLGITGELRHAGYIGNWIELLRDDNRAIFTVASKASQAANFGRSRNRTDESPTTRAREWAMSPISSGDAAMSAR